MFCIFIFILSVKKCIKYGGSDTRLPGPFNKSDMESIGLFVEVIAGGKIWTSIVDGDILEENGDGTYEDYYNRGLELGIVPM